MTSFHSNLHICCPELFGIIHAVRQGHTLIEEVQCILFLVALWFVKVWMNEDDHSRKRRVSVFSYVLAGMGKYFLIALGLMAAMLVLNYFGLIVFTSWAGYLAWRLVRLALIIAFYLIILLIMFVKWAWKALVWLWNLIF